MTQEELIRELQQVIPPHREDFLKLDRVSMKNCFYFLWYCGVYDEKRKLISQELYNLIWDNSI